MRTMILSEGTTVHSNNYAGAKIARRGWRECIAGIDFTALFLGLMCCKSVVHINFDVIRQ